MITTQNNRIATIDLDAPAVQTHVHRVTLINHSTDKSIKLDIFTLSDSFTAVWREVNYQRQLLQLTGYVMTHEAEIEQISMPF